MQSYFQNQNRLTIFTPTHNVLKFFIVHDGVCLTQECRDHLTLQDLIVIFKAFCILQN